MARTFRDAFSVETSRLLSRRSAFWHAADGALASLTAATLPEAATAGKRRRKKKKKKGKGGPSCAETCHGSCGFCATRADGPLLCGSLGGGALQCNAPCFSDNDCVGTSRPYCITEFINRETGEIVPPCSEGGGWCLALAACVA